MKDPVKRECWVKPLGERETYDDVKRIVDSGVTCDRFLSLSL